MGQEEKSTGNRRANHNVKQNGLKHNIWLREFQLTGKKEVFVDHFVLKGNEMDKTQGKSSRRQAENTKKARARSTWLN
jgi:hypothetical protein